MSTISDWAQAWGVPQAAVSDLQSRLSAVTQPEPVQAAPRSEAAVQAAVRVTASQRGMRLWRNNLGAFADPNTGGWVRFGLANDTPQMNAAVKSADLIGIAPRIIQPDDIGKLFGQFVSLEVKHAGWRFTGTERELAQQRWAEIITSLGGDARFVSDPSHV